MRRRHVVSGDVGRPAVGRPQIAIQINKATASPKSQADIITYTDGSSDDPTMRLSYGYPDVQNVTGTTTTTGTGGYRVTGTLQEMHIREGTAGPNGLDGVADPGPVEPFEIDVTCP